MDKNRDAWEKFTQSGKISDYIDYRRSILSEVSADITEPDFPENEDESEHLWTGD